MISSSDWLNGLSNLKMCLSFHYNPVIQKQMMSRFAKHQRMFFFVLIITTSPWRQGHSSSCHQVICHTQFDIHQGVIANDDRPWLMFFYYQKNRNAKVKKKI